MIFWTSGPGVFGSSQVSKCSGLRTTGIRSWICTIPGAAALESRAQESTCVPFCPVQTAHEIDKHRSMEGIFTMNDTSG